MSTQFHGRLVQLAFNFPRLCKGGGKGWRKKSYWFSQLQSTPVHGLPALLFLMELWERGIL